MNISAIVIINKMQHNLKAHLPEIAGAVFLDRDGVLNEKMPEGQYVRSVSDFRLLPGVARAIARLNSAGYRLLVVSNQRGIALGLYTSRDVDAIHSDLQTQLAAFGGHIDAFYICPHDHGACLCRKPLPGMFEQAMREFPEVIAAKRIMIGDSLSDMQFGRQTGMQTILLETGHGNFSAGEGEASIADWKCASLSEAVDRILLPCEAVEGGPKPIA